MRIAVSGTHGVGKSTLIDEFLRRHPEYVHEPEPYTVLVEDFGEEFSAEPCVEDFVRPLAFNIDRLHQEAPGENEIYERCPVDFIAYIDVLSHESSHGLIEVASEAIKHPDLIVYLPFDGETDKDEHPKLQRAVDRRLSFIFREDELGIDATVIEAEGSTAQRLRIIEQAMFSKPT